MYDANNAEFIAIRMYVTRTFREMLSKASSSEEVVEVLRLMFKRESHLFDKLKAVIEKAGLRPIKLEGGRGVVDIERKTYVEDVNFLLRRLVSNSHTVLRGIIADMILRTLEIVWGEDLGWADAKGFQFLIRDTPRIRVVGILWPPEPGRSGQSFGSDPRGIFEGLVRTPEGRHIWSYWQVCGQRYFSFGRSFPEYRKEEVSVKDFVQLPEFPPEK